MKAWWKCANITIDGLYIELFAFLRVYNKTARAATCQYVQFLRPKRGRKVQNRAMKEPGEGKFFWGDLTPGPFPKGEGVPSKEIGEGKFVQHRVPEEEKSEH